LVKHGEVTRRSRKPRESTGDRIVRPIPTRRPQTGRGGVPIIGSGLQRSSAWPDCSRNQQACSHVDG
jgi:hypothetical protein